jgi:hypothetical protein
LRRTQAFNDITDSVETARTALAAALDNLLAEVARLEKVAGASLEPIRRIRFACISEVTQIMTPLKDLRQFFLSSNHEAEVARLREFVDLCERLEKLKASGFLDTVADTILKLDSK